MPSPIYRGGTLQFTTNRHGLSSPVSAEVIHHLALAARAPGPPRTATAIGSAVIRVGSQRRRYGPRRPISSPGNQPVLPVRASESLNNLSTPFLVYVKCNSGAFA